jgi:hypothetical protein
MWLEKNRSNEKLKPTKPLGTQEGSVRFQGVVYEIRFFFLRFHIAQDRRKSIHRRAFRPVAPHPSACGCHLPLGGRLKTCVAAKKGAVKKI